jgi:hypothetical protein
MTIYGVTSQNTTLFITTEELGVEKPDGNIVTYERFA